MGTHSGRVAVVTGAASGFGRAIAVELARRGADIVAVDLHDAQETASDVEAQQRKVICVTADVSNPDAVAATADSMTALSANADILVNCAGVFPFQDFFELTFEQWKRTQAINLDSQFLMAKLVAQGMREAGWGRIVNFASNSLGLAVPGLTHYMASKGGVIGFTRALATDLAPFGITVNAICPTASRTPGGQSNIGDDMLEMVANMQAIKHVGTAADILGTVAFLTSDDCGFLTGQTIVADGGLMRV
ncbi:SDR family NAD(P)-dependent oxidoreductase [Actinomycetospora flava]|uniref:SDR family NAD(P)-dependent oxidoreductase n=1 Tax=Actinomycetospora flava TaxID=3129232 RepID=A0ABU8M4Y4_9PSEU